MLVITIVPAVAVLYGIYLMINITVSRSKYKHFYIPPYQSFLLGHLKELKDFKGKFSDKMLAWSAEGGNDCIVLFSARRNHIHVVDNLKIKKVLNTPVLMKSKQHTFSFFDGHRVVGNNSIVTEPGTSVWAAKRRLLDPYFHTLGLRRFLEDVNIVSDSMIAEVKHVCRKGDHVDVSALLKKHVTLIIARTIFGIKDSDSFNKCIPLLNSVFYGIFVQHRNKNTFFLPWVKRDLKLKVNKSIVELRKFLMEHLLSYDTNENSDTCFSQVILSNTTNGILDVENCIDDMIVYFFAGIDTSFNTMNFALYQMLKSPHVYRDIETEVFEVFSDKEHLCYDGVRKFNLLEAFIKETLRLFPTALYASKFATEDFDLCGSRVPKNTFVHVNIVCVQQSEKYWKNPQQFDISRWETAPEPFSFIPFSGGSRSCLGKQLAMMEMKVLISSIIKNFEIDFDGTELKDIGVREHMTSGLSENLLIKFRPRN